MWGISLAGALCGIVSMVAVEAAAATDSEVGEAANSGGAVLVVGFIVVGIVGAVVAARLAKRSREE